jgi:galactosamine-6-phosphate isomerase
MIKPTVFADHEAMSRHAADWLTLRIQRKPDSLVCVAAGYTPLRTYQLFAGLQRHNPGSLGRLRLLKLDEWGGLDSADPATCEHAIRQHLVSPLGLDERYIGFEPNPSDPHTECRRIAGWLSENGPIDTCILGLGVNGHLGFNEPAPTLSPHAHVARLSHASLGHTMLTYSGATPRYGLTLGMADLLHSDAILLLVSGPSKRDPLRRLLEGPISTEFPASFLALHPRLYLFCDSAALPPTADRPDPPT